MRVRGGGAAGERCTGEHQHQQQRQRQYQHQHCSRERGGAPSAAPLAALFSAPPPRLPSASGRGAGARPASMPSPAIFTAMPKR